jgi:hypothetical protein
MSSPDDLIIRPVLLEDGGVVDITRGQSTYTNALASSILTSCSTMSN